MAPKGLRLVPGLYVSMVAGTLTEPGTNTSVFTFLSEFQTPWQGQTAIEVVVLSLILVASCTGNSMVVVALVRNPKLRTVTNMFICNLATTDLLFTAGIPFIAVTRITHHWIFGEFVCKFVTYIQFVSSVCSIVTMVVIAVDRFVCVCLISKRNLTMKETVGVIVIVWLLSASFPVPVAVAQTVQHIDKGSDSFHFCGISWPNNFSPEIYLGFMAVCFFFVPLVLITIIYIYIIRVVHASTSRTHQTGNGRTEKSARRHIRMVKMFASIVVLFVMMWLPFFIVSFIGVHLKQITSTHFTACLIIALSNTCQNPILYGYFNTKFRAEFRKMCCTGRLCRKWSPRSVYGVQGTEMCSTGAPSCSSRGEYD